MTSRPAVNPRIAIFFVELQTRVLGIFAILAGLDTIIGGKIRWTAPAFNTALKVPGSPPSWGVFLGLVGVIMLWAHWRGRYRLLRYATYCGAAWGMFFAGSVYVSALNYPIASRTGFWTNGLLAVIFVLTGVAYSHSIDADGEST